MAKKIVKYEVLIKSTKQIKQFDIPKFYTNDLNSVVFQFVVLDLTVEEQEEATATIMIYARDGSFFQNPPTDVEKVGNTFSYTLKENEGNHAGIAKIQLVVTIPGTPTAEYASQLYEFDILNGLETKVAQEVMIYDWTTLTREAREYLDEFAANEILREAEFDNNEFDRNAAFVVSQDARTLAFGTEQTNRGTAFTAEQNERTTAFNESESGRTTAETGRVTAESNRVTAESGRVTKESQRVTAESSRVTAEGNRVTAESGRVTAESGRVTAETNRAAAFTAFNTRLTAEETATAANKISAVKGKTFADVDARIEDVEFDTALMGTNKVTNGDFLNGSTGWTPSNSNLTISSGIGSFTATAQNGLILTYCGERILGNLYYVFSRFKANSNLVMMHSVYGGNITTAHSGSGSFEFKSTLLAGTSALGSWAIGIIDTRPSGWAVVDVDFVGVIDLTATFGKGNEPTVEQMDGIMAKFPNSWFNGTANLFRANATLNKLLAVDARTEFEENNLVSSGNVERIDTALAIWGGYKYYINAVNGNKYYVALEIKSDTPNAVRLQWSNSAVIGVLAEVNTYKRLSGIITNDKPTGQTYVSATDTRSSGWTPTYTKNATVIDLTAAFGVGKEPTLAEMDRLMARFPNSWFDGVKPIQTIETLYQEKANKAQEAWITPTLLNGATGTIQYRKNEFGEVEFKGTLTGTAGTASLTMPAGYRPTVAVYDVTSNVANGASVYYQINTTGSLFINYPYSSQSLSLTGKKFPTT